MSIIITTKNGEKIFQNKEIINIGTNASCDYNMNVGFDFILTLQVDEKSEKCIVLNNFNSDKILFKGQPIGQKCSFEKVCKFIIANTDDFISIKISKPAQEFTGNSQLDIQKRELEKRRVAIVKQVGYAISDLKNKLSLNFKSTLFVHIALFLCSIVTAFGVSNFLTGLQIEETKNFIHLPTNIKILMTFAGIIYGLSLVLKQGVYLFFQNKVKSNQSTLLAQNFMLFTSSAFFIGIYVINLLYYMNINLLFALLMSLFFVGLTTLLSATSGYFKYTGHSLSCELDKHEYREDFELVLNDYRNWIEQFINKMSKTKLENIKDKLFNLQLKSVGEILLGILTAPFLAFGVSNTLAMCFPDAAGWIKISGIRFSPVFLVLATFLIIFAFFAFVNAFLSIRKIQASSVIKQDGFSNPLMHGVEILGIQGTRKLETEKIRSFVIGCAIIFIEFTMNSSYFLTEIGGDLQGMLLSIIAALLPTALLIAETYMLSQTKYDIYACEEIIAKIN